MNWQPNASIENLRRRAQIIQQIRAFFAARDILEVDTPLLCRTVNSDPYIQAFVCAGSPAFDHQACYLQTSPEFAMKRLLAANSGAIYQICKAFRQDEAARLHNPEFTMMEWYRPGFDHHQLMDEVTELVQAILKVTEIPRLTYQALFLKYAALDPFTSSTAEIQHCAQQQANLSQTDLSRDTWLDIIMTHIIEPQLHDTLVFVYDFPESQAALARIRPGKIPVAERFELYAYGIELANGFHELTDAEEQHQRFIQDNKMRAEQNLPILPIDEHLIAALRSGMPQCAGVALGVDRLIMLALNAKQLAEVLSFTAERV
jgi:lysyl-tRNA synthetase class 2